MAIASAHKDNTIVNDETQSDDESSSSVSTVVPTYAFAFDIDGVLLAGVISGAREALRVLNGENKNSRDRDFSLVGIEAVFAFANSRFWGEDTQIILEQNGRMGTLSETFGEGPPIYFPRNDVVWLPTFVLTGSEWALSASSSRPCTGSVPASPEIGHVVRKSTARHLPLRA